MRQLAVLMALTAPAAAWAQEQPPRPEAPGPVENRARADSSRDFLRFAFNFYQQNDGGGNEHLEEDMTVLEPMLLFSKTLSDRWHGTFKAQGDIISAASIEKRFPSGTQSGASGDKYVNLEGGAFYAWSDQTRIGAGASFATEYDYRSVGLWTKWTHETPDKNDSFAVRVGAFFDTVRVIRFDGTDDEGNESRQSLSLGVGWTRVLGPETVGSLNWDLTIQSGFLSTPYNSVVAAGTEVVEELPDSRIRNSLHARVRHLLLEDVAVEPGAGVYVDDWGGRAFNVELAAFWEAIPDSLIVKPSWRFHWQGEIDYSLSDSAAAIPEFRTQDSDLADFTSHTLGLKLLFPNATVLGDGIDLEVGGDLTMRSDGLDSWSFSVGTIWRF